MVPRADFDRQLRQLQDEVLVMGSMAEKAIAKALDALKRRDLEESRRVIQEDDYIDSKRFEIEDRCITLISTQQPMARDIRLLLTMLHISVELERMGDHAEGIAKISLMMGNEPPIKPLIDIPLMADKATTMLHRSLDALVNRDTISALQVCNDDDEVDNLYDQVYNELASLHDQGPLIYSTSYLSAVGGPRPGAHRRPRHQHRRTGNIPRNRQDDGSQRRQGLDANFCEVL